MNHISETLLNEYLDRRLDSVQHAAIATHLAECPACAKQAAALEHLFAQLAASPQQELAVDLSLAVMASLRAPVEVPRFLRGAVLVQAVGALAVLAWLLPQLSQWLSPWLSFHIPDLTGLLAVAEALLLSWIQALRGLPLPAEIGFSLGLESSPTTLALLLGAAVLLGMIGNLLLLGRHPKFIKQGE